MSFQDSKAVQIELESTIRNRPVFREEFQQFKRDFLDYLEDSKKKSTAYLDLFYSVLDTVDNVSLSFYNSKPLPSHSFKRHTRLLVAENIAQEIKAQVL